MKNPKPIKIVFEVRYCFINAKDSDIFRVTEDIVKIETTNLGYNLD